MKIWIERSTCLLAMVGVAALAGCGSDPAAPEDTTPQPGHVYNWAGTGYPGYGDMNEPPAQTQLYWPADIAFAPDSRPIVLDWNNHRVIKTNAAGEFELIVGVAGGDFGDPCPASGPCEDVVAVDAKLNHPTHVVFDPANGDMILCAWHNSMLMRIDMTTGLMDRFCGTGARSYNGDDRPAAGAFVDLPVSLAYDPQGRLVFADQANMIIRMIDDSGVIHTIAGLQPIEISPGVLQYQAGFSGNEGLATEARFRFDRGQVADPGSKICYDANGNLYVTDTLNHSVRMIDTNGYIHQVAGVGPYDTANEPRFSGDGGQAVDAHLYEPRDVAVDALGNVFIADTGNHVIRMVAPDGKISTVVGRARPTNALPLSGSNVRAEDGYAARDVTLTSPLGIEVDATGRLWIADTKHNLIRILYR